MNPNKISVSVVELPSGELLAFAGTPSEVTAKAQQALVGGGSGVLVKGLLFTQRINPARGEALEEILTAPETPTETKRKKTKE